MPLHSRALVSSLSTGFHIEISQIKERLPSSSWHNLEAFCFHINYGLFTFAIECSQSYHLYWNMNSIFMPKYCIYSLNSTFFLHSSLLWSKLLFGKAKSVSLWITLISFPHHFISQYHFLNYYFSTPPIPYILVISFLKWLLTQLLQQLFFQVWLQVSQDFNL